MSTHQQINNWNSDILCAVCTLHYNICRFVSRNLGVVRQSTLIFWHFSVFRLIFGLRWDTHTSRENIKCVCVIAFFIVQTLSSCLAICWSQLFYYRGSERWASVELVSGLKMSTICFSYNSFQLLFLLPFVSLSRTLSVSQLPFHRHKSHRTWNANK